VIQNPEENLNRFYRIREEKAKKSAILDSKKGFLSFFLFDIDLF